MNYRLKDKDDEGVLQKRKECGNLSIPVELNQNFNKSNTILQSNYNSGVWWYFLGLRFWYFWHLQNLLT